MTRPTLIYISGPMTGLPELNFPAFHRAEALLRAEGWQTVNPATLNPDPAASWEECMRTDIRAICDCTHMAMYEAGTFSGGTYTPQQLEDCLRRHPGVRNWMLPNKQMYKVTGHAAIVLAVCYLGSLTRPHAAEVFMRLLLDGAGLEKGSPVLTLRDRLQQDRAATSKLPASYVAQLVIHAYNAFANGDCRHILRGSRTSGDLPRVMK